jgi:hypothetical protein
MLILLLLVLLAAGAVVAAAAVSAAGREDADRSLFGGAGPPLILLGGAVAVVALGTAVAVVVGIRGGGRPDEEQAATPPPPASLPAAPRPSPASVEREPADRRALPAGTGREVTVRAGGSPTVVDRLPESTVLVVNAEGFEPGTGKVAQCGVDTEGPADCRNGFPVEFGAEGTARFQYLVSDRVHEGERCGTGQRACQLVVLGSHGEAEGRAFTVFHDPAPPPGKVSAEPGGPLADGDLVTLTATEFPPATRLLAAQCPVDIGLHPGGACRPAVATRSGPDGAAVFQLRVHTGGMDGVACGPREPCSIRVTADAPVVPLTLPVTFSAGPSARYDRLRLAGGVLLAALLLALGWYLLRTTDWREPAAASTPEMDRAALDA